MEHHPSWKHEHRLPRIMKLPPMPGPYNRVALSSLSLWLRMPPIQLRARPSLGLDSAELAFSLWELPLAHVSGTGSFGMESY